MDNLSTPFQNDQGQASGRTDSASKRLTKRLTSSLSQVGFLCWREQGFQTKRSRSGLWPDRLGLTVLFLLLLTLSAFTAQAQFPTTPTNNAADCGQALALDGVDDYVSIPDNDAFDFPGAYTLEAWFKTGTLKDQMIVARHNGGTDGEWYLSTTAAGRLRHTHITSADRVDMDYIYGYNDDAWHHLAGVYTGAKLELYLDGTLVTEKDRTGTTKSTSYPLTIGSYTSGWYWDGAIDEVKIWNRALTAQEISQSAAGTHPTDEATVLVAHYDFNNQVGATTLADITVNGYDGTLNNMDPTTAWINADGTGYLWYADADEDGYAERIASCDDLSATHTTDIGSLDLVSTTEFDCDDNNAAINPGITEILLDGIDNDCNPATPDNAIVLTYTDGDIQAFHGAPDDYPNPACAGIMSVVVPSGMKITTIDADYTVDARNGAAVSAVFTKLICTTNGTGTGYNSGEGDLTYTGHTMAEGITGTAEFKLNLWYQTSPHECSSEKAIVQNNTWTLTVHLEEDDRWYPDADGDGYVVNEPIESASDPSTPEIDYYQGTNLPNGVFDCDDTNADAQEVLLWYADADGDGYMAEVGESCGAPGTEEYYFTDPETEYNNFIDFDDCDDTNASINPGATEIPGDGIDNDCNPTTADGPANSLNFDGTDDYVSIPDDDAVEFPDAYTLEAWFKTGTLKDQMIVARHNGGTDGEWYLGTTVAGALRHTHITSDGRVDMDYTYAYNDDAWHHLAGVYTGSKLQLYLDGALVKEQDRTGTTKNTSHPSIIGAYTTGWYWSGSIDEVRIWNIARSAEDIGASMNCELNGEETGLLAYYAFNQGDDGADNAGITTLFDATGNGHNGTLTNFALNSTTSNWISGSIVTTGTPCNQPPVLTTIGDQSVTLGGTLAFTASATDADEDPLTYSLDATSAGLGMTIGETSGDFSWAPVAGQAGPHEVTVTVDDATATDSETFTVTVNKVSQTITFDPLSAVTYGDASFDLAATASSGLAVSYASSDETVATVDGSTVTIVGAGTATITASQAGDDTYQPADNVTQELTVNQAALTVTADDAGRTYGAANPAFTVSYAGFVNSEDASVLDTAPTAGTTATETSNAGAYAISASGGSDNNYAFSYIEGVLTVSKATLTVTADDASKVYGAANPALTVSYAGFVNSEDASVLDTAPTAGTTATETSNAGTYDINGSGGADNNYSFSYVAGTLTVSRAMLTATADDQSREYGAANPAFTVSYAGFVNGDGEPDLDTAPAGSATATATSSVGAYAITASGGVDTNYDFSYSEGTLTISKAPLTATADDQTITYGDALPTLTISYTGLANGEDASVLDTAPSVATTATGSGGSDAGSYPITVTGGSDNNYDLTLADGTLTINKADQTITFDAIADIDLQSTNTVNLSTSSDAGLAVSFTLTQGDGTIDGTTLTVNSTGTFTVEAAQAGTTNYNPATATRTFNAFDTSKDDQTITFGALSAKTYGDANFNLNASASSGLAVTYLSSNTSVATVAGSTVTIVGAGTTTITASQPGNTDFNPAPIVLQDLVVDKATLTVTADDQDRTYGSTNPELTVTYAGFANDDLVADLNTAPTAATTATASSDAGTYAITVAGGTDDNYTFSYVEGTLTVNPAVLTVTADDRSKTYGSANPALTYMIEGYVNGDDEGAIVTMPTTSTTATEASDAGAYAITAAGGVADNYSFNYQEGTLTINPAGLTVTADDQSRAYGAANPSFTVSYTGFVNGDSESDLDVAPVGSTTATASSDAGSYAITVSGGNDNNYTFTYGEGALTVSQAALTVAADDQAIVYGDALPALTMSYTGFVNSDSEADLDVIPTAGTTATGSGASDAGDYPITLSGGNDNNYTFTYVEGTLTINKAEQTITVDPIADKDVSDAPFAIQASTPSGLALSYEITGPATISGSTITLTGATGTVEVTISQGGNQNYHAAVPMSESFLVTDATKQTQTITFDEIPDKAYGDVFTLTATASSDLAVSYTLISGPATLSGAEVTITGVGEIAIRASQEGDATFNPASPVTQSFMAGQVNLTVTADNKQITYGQELSALTISYSGFISGDTEADLSAVPEASVSATSESDAGTYEITVSGGSATNYTFTYQPGTLTINKATAQVTITNLEQEADGSAKEPTVVTDPAGLNYTITYDGNEGAPTQAGSYEVVVTIAATNYAGTATATFVLTGEEVLGVSPDAQVTIYPNPAEQTMEVSSASDEWIRVYDLSGILQLEGKTNTRIAIGQLRSGVYLVELSGGKSYLRLIKR